MLKPFYLVKGDFILDKYLEEVLKRLQETGMSVNDALYLICCLLDEQARAFIYWEDHLKQAERGDKPS